MIILCLSNSVINLTLSFNIKLAYSVLTPGGSGGDVYICLGQRQTFLYKVPKQGSLTRLEWRIDLDDSSSVKIVTLLYTIVLPSTLKNKGKKILWIDLCTITVVNEFLFIILGNVCFHNIMLLILNAAID